MWSLQHWLPDPKTNNGRQKASSANISEIAEILLWQTKRIYLWNQWNWLQRGKPQHQHWKQRRKQNTGAL